jgi:hypothetical protein
MRNCGRPRCVSDRLWPEVFSPQVAFRIIWTLTACDWKYVSTFEQTPCLHRFIMESTPSEVVGIYDDNAIGYLRMGESAPYRPKTQEHGFAAPRST